MSLLRFLLTALFALFAMLAGIFVAVSLVVAGTLARIFGKKTAFRAHVRAGGQRRGPVQQRARHDPNVIDVEATTIPPEPPKLEK